MALKIYAKSEGKLTCAFKNDVKNLANFRLQDENSNLILESKMVEINQKTQNNQIDKIQCKNFILPWR